MLKRLMSLVGGLIAAPVGVGCTKCNPSTDSRLEGRTFTPSFSIEPSQTQTITGKPDLGDSWASIRFAEPLRFKQLDETIETVGYETYTLGEKGEAHTGRFTMRATLRKGYTGGPPGSATELFVEVDDVRLAGTLSPPQAPPGARPLLPGQFVVRPIREGELSQLDDRYVIELPANRTAELVFSPWREDYEFKLSLSRNGVLLPIRYDGKASYTFEIKETGIHELRVQALGGSSKEPDCYTFSLCWGETLSDGGKLIWHKIGFRTAVSPGNSPNTATNR